MTYSCVLLCLDNVKEGDESSGIESDFGNDFTLHLSDVSMNC